MHYLSHLLLCKNYPENFLIGNFTGLTSRRALQYRFKNRDYSNVSYDLFQGLIMHDLIEHYSKNHPITIECNAVLKINDKFKAYTLDLFFDHFLALNWDTYSDTPFNEFIDNRSRILKKDNNKLTYKGKKVLKTIIKHNLLDKYATINGLHSIIHLLGKISGNIAVTESAIVDLTNHYNFLQHKFHEFFPQLIRFINRNSEILVSIPEIRSNWTTIDAASKAEYLNDSLVKLNEEESMFSYI